MPSQRLILTEPLLHLIRGMHPNLKRKVRAALDEILRDPQAGKALKNELAGLRSYRLGRIRIVYKISGQVIEIVTIGPRITIYEETLRLLKKE